MRGWKSTRRGRGRDGELVSLVKESYRVRNGVEYEAWAVVVVVDGGGGGGGGETAWM